MLSHKRILIACLSDPGKSPRPIRSINFCVKRGAQVTVLSPPPSIRIPKVKYIPFQGNSRVLNFARKAAGILFQAVAPSQSAQERIIGYGHGFQRRFRSLISQEFDLIIVEDLDLLPFAFSIKGQAKLMMDAREYYPRQRESEILFKFFQAPYRTGYCRKYLPECDAVITVSLGLSDAYRKNFNISPFVIRSVPVYHEISHKACSGDSIKLVHHGVANPNRQLLKLIDILDLVDSRFSLDLYLTGSTRVIAQLNRRIKNNSRIRLFPPVKFDQIIPTIAQYDVGLFYVEPVTFNLRHCLPNKLFEFIQARLAVAIGPSPDMAAIVSAYRCGIVAPEFTVQSMAQSLNALNADRINAAKENSSKAARELCFEEEGKKLETIIEGLLFNKPAI